MRIRSGDPHLDVAIPAARLSRRVLRLVYPVSAACLAFAFAAPGDNSMGVLPRIVMTAWYATGMGDL